ncbi:MAG: putative selenocysteine system protein [Candidatus Thorarchaeota archaeon]
MAEADNQTKTFRSIDYEKIDPSAAFRIAWYIIASKPGILLKEYTEAESRLFEASATFHVDLDDINIKAQVIVEEEPPNLVLNAWGEDESILETYIDNTLNEIQEAFSKFKSLDDDRRQRLTRALIAKACWDKLVADIFRKAPLSDIYVQLAHGREMIIKATEGEEVSPVSLTTSAWLSKIESLPREEALPGGMAAEIAKKSVEWKKETIAFIRRFL